MKLNGLQEDQACEFEEDCRARRGVISFWYYVGSCSRHSAIQGSAMKCIAMHCKSRHAPKRQEAMQRDSPPPSTTKISANNAKRGIADADVFLAAGFPEGPLPFPAIARCWKAFVRRRRSIDDFEQAMV